LRAGGRVRNRSAVGEPLAPPVSSAVELLLAARQGRRRLAMLPDEARPRTVGEAYAIQDAVASALGAIGGWKVGAKSTSSEPTCAPLPVALILSSPQRFAAGRFAHNGVEAELAFTLSRDLPARPEPYRVADLRTAVETIHPAIEIVDSRFVDLGAVDALSMLADFQSNGSLVVGNGVALAHTFDSSMQEVALDIAGVRAVQGRGGNPAGDVLRLLAWLANHVAARTGGLRRGDIVTTGSWTGMRFVAPGTRVEATFEGIGGVDVGL
jgi:2-keto-4-pentenoate hydratase